MERHWPYDIMSCAYDTIGRDETPNAETITAMREAESNVALDSFDLNKECPLLDTIHSMS